MWQQSQDKKMEVQRRQRRKLILAARRKRAAQRRAIRLQRMQSRQQWMQTMMHQYYTNIMRTAEVWAYQPTNEQWLGDFSFSRETFTYICPTLKPALQRQDTSDRLCIPLDKRAEYRTVANCLLSVGLLFAAAVCVTFVRLELQYFGNHSSSKHQTRTNYLRWLCTWKRAVGFQCVGAHIPILKPPPRYQSDLHNRKAWHSIIVQATVDGKGMFWDLNVGQPGGEITALVSSERHAHGLGSRTVMVFLAE
ncbi:hypothetical protein F2P79_024175 [Pimephales promelas]|nr:hypothetical protein F2P79_024175 [Pimephales promelas]